MRILWLTLLLPTFFEASFGNSYVRNTHLCRLWDCLNRIQGLPDSLPPRETFELNIKSLLPQGPWQDVVGKALDACYRDKPKINNNICLGQALMQCVVDQLIDNCPETNLRKEDSCSPLTAFAGTNYLFSQIRFKNLENNLPTEKRSLWFLKNLFTSKCCDLPELLNTTILNQCGATSFIYITEYRAQTEQVDIVSLEDNTKKLTTTQQYVDNAPSNDNGLNIVNINIDQKQDPLECCDIDAFINPIWRTECGFHLSLDSSRLHIQDDGITTTELPTTTEIPKKSNSVKIVPLSCEKTTCVFRKLNLISDIGTVDKQGVMKLLDNFTNTYPEWSKAKARVATHCLNRKIWEYEADCEINKVLACIFDVMSENCPHSKKGDPCKHNSNLLRDDILCQISSTKLRARNRHQFCGHPNLVHYDILSQCDVDSLSRLEYADATQKITNRLKLKNPVCKDLTPSTTCILSKMRALNKYKFMDYFGMRDAINNFTELTEWSAFKEIYLSAFMSVNLYKEHCNSPRKLLNVVHTMLMTCPASKRKNTQQCSRIFADITTNSKKDDSHRHLAHMFNSKHIFTQPEATVTDLVLNSKSVPPVKIIDIRPTPLRKRPLVLLPVYLRTGNVFRSAPAAPNL